MQHDEPPRDDVAPGQAEQRGEDVEPVGDGVEELPDPGHLAPAAGEIAVEVVGEAADHQHGERPAVVTGRG